MRKLILIVLILVAGQSPAWAKCVYTGQGYVLLKAQRQTTSINFAGGGALVINCRVRTGWLYWLGGRACTGRRLWTRNMGGKRNYCKIIGVN